LFNDAVAAILFSVAVGLATGGSSPDPVALSIAFVWSLGGGVLIGAVIGVAAIVLASRSHEHLVEVALTVLAAFGAFFVAEQAHASGILSTIVAGLVVGNVGVLSERNEISDKAKTFALEVWEFAAFLANSAIFPLIGLAIGGAAFTAETAWLLGGLILLVL